MSHLASADEPADPANTAQLQTFERLRALLPPAPASLAASDGLMLGRAFHFDLVRRAMRSTAGRRFAVRGRRWRRWCRSTRACCRCATWRRAVRSDTRARGARRGGRAGVATLAAVRGGWRTAARATAGAGGSVILHGARLPSGDYRWISTVDVTDCPIVVTRGDVAGIDPSLRWSRPAARRETITRC